MEGNTNKGGIKETRVVEVVVVHLSGVRLPPPLHNNDTIRYDGLPLMRVGHEPSPPRRRRVVVHPSIHSIILFIGQFVTSTMLNDDRNPLFSFTNNRNKNGHIIRSDSYYRDSYAPRFAESRSTGYSLAVVLRQCGPLALMKFSSRM